MEKESIDVSLYYLEKSATVLINVVFFNES